MNIRPLDAPTSLLVTSMQKQQRTTEHVSIQRHLLWIVTAIASSTLMVTAFATRTKSWAAHLPTLATSKRKQQKRMDHASSLMKAMTATVIALLMLMATVFAINLKSSDVPMRVHATTIWTIQRKMVLVITVRVEILQATIRSLSKSMLSMELQA